MERTTTLMHDDIINSHFWNILTDNNTVETWPNVSEEHEEFLKSEQLVRIIMPVLYGLIIIIGLVGNILVIAVILLHKEIRGITNTLIMSLAVTDLLYIVFCVPFKAIESTLPFWPCGDLWCRIHTYLENVCHFASMYTLVLVSLDRYIALVYPIRGIILRTKQNFYIVLVSIWSLITLGNIPFLLIAKEESFDSGNMHEQVKFCVIVFEDASGTSICLFLFAYMLPLTLLCILYGHMLKVFLTVKISGAHNRASYVRFQSKKRVTKMVVLVVTVFAVCWLPIQILMLYNNNSNTQEATTTIVTLVHVANFMAYMNSCINPILYAFYSHTFRKGFKNIFLCRKTRYPEREIMLTQV